MKDDQTEKELKLAKLQWEIDQATEKIQILEDRIDRLGLKLDVVEDKVEKVEVKANDTNKALAPITKVVYGLIALILVTFFTILASYVFRAPLQ